MISFKVELACFTGAKTSTYVKTNTQEQAKRIAEARVNQKSPNGWRAVRVTAEYPPEGYTELW